MELATITAWTFLKEVPIPADVQQLMTNNEQPYAAFKTLRDSAIFTNKRLIVRDAQGGHYGQEGRNLFSSVFFDQYVVN